MSELSGKHILALTLVGAALFVLSPLVNGFVISMLWDWFLVPIFGLPMLPVVGAVGIALIARVIIEIDYTAATEKYKDLEFPELLGAMFGIMVRRIGGNLFLLAFGWLLHLLM